MTNEFLDIDKALEQLGLPDDFIEVTGTPEDGPDRQTTERIKQRTLQMAQSNLIEHKPRSKRRKVWYTSAVAVAVFLLLIGVVGPNNVRAAVNRLLLYIPGFGVQSTENVNFFAPTLVRAERSGVKIDIRGLLADTKGTSLIAYVEGGILEVNSSYLVDESGEHYLYQSGHEGEAGNIQILGVQYMPLPASVKQVALVIPSMSNWTISIPLSSTTNINFAEKFGPSATTNNVTVSAQATGFRDETKVILLVQSLRGGIPFSVGKSGLTSNDGKTYSLNPQPGFFGSGLIYLSTSKNIGDTVTISIPDLLLQQEVNGRATVPVPQKTSPLNLNQTLHLGALDLNLTKAEIVEENGTTNLRIYVQPSVIQGGIINSLDQLKINGEMVSWSSRFDPSTGGLEWFQIPVPKGAKSVRINIGQIKVQVKGPWEIKLPVAPGF